jgi:diguanylate cyclase (GGDEF)-like protein
MTEKKLRILLAENGPGVATAALRGLFPEEQNRLDLTVVSAISTLLPTIQVAKPEVILLDLSLVHPDALDMVRWVHRSAPTIPLIILAEESDQEIARQCVSDGVMDYLLKGSLDAPSLERVLQAALKHNTLGGLVDLLRDPLTGLYIRDGFLTVGTGALDTARRNLSTLILVCMQIANLATVRAQLGPKAAENSLREVAELLAGSFRRSDITARIGESQFAALAIDAVAPSSPVLRQRLEKRVAALNRDRGPWGPLEIRISAGFWSPKDARSFSEFLDAVEKGLRLPPVVPGQAMESCQTVNAAKEK